MVLTEEPEIVNLIAQDDGAATIEALIEDAKNIFIIKSSEFKKVILGQK